MSKVLYCYGAGRTVHHLRSYFKIWERIVESGRVDHSTSSPGMILKKDWMEKFLEVCFELYHAALVNVTGAQNL